MEILIFMSQSFFFIIVNTSSLQSSEKVIQVETLQSFVDDKISLSSSSNIFLESETILIRTIRSFGLLLCSCLLITNWLRLGIYFLPKFYPNTIQYSSNLCLIQSFFLHVLTLFHINLTISIRLFWHYCFIFSKYWQTITYRRIFTFFLCIFICLCLFTLPSLSNEWASVIFDRILNICIVNYTFHLSYTFFVLTFTCLIPFILLMISHREQMKCIKQRMSKYLSTFTIEQHKHKWNLTYRKTQFQYASYVILIWSLFNIILLICVHIPIEHIKIKSMIYYIQLFAFLFDPILYIFIFRSLSIITLLRPTNELYF
jgi:hypothetical protein